MNEISQALTRLFDRHRIIFWYDAKAELGAEYETLTLPDVEKISLGNNQFGVKYRILSQEPQQKFLLYHAGQRPEHLPAFIARFPQPSARGRVSRWSHQRGSHARVRRVG
jgi:hypothetical protein